MTRISNAQLGRDAKSVIDSVTGENSYDFYANKTEKYISIKLPRNHLCPEQLKEVADRLAAMHPTRFLRVGNGTSNCSKYMPNGSGVLRGYNWKEEKVLIRFAQA